MIAIELSGGLGNQLFQWQAAVLFGLKTNKEIYIDCRKIVSPRDRIGLFDFRLPFRDKIHYQVDARKQLKIWTTRRDQFDFYFSNKKNMKNFFKLTEEAYSIKNITFLPSQKENVFLSGYFQSSEISQIFKTNFYDLSQISPYKFPSIEFKNLENCIMKENPIIVHCRRGDYKFAANHWGLLSERYYFEALESIGATKHDLVYIFSDSISEVRNEFSELKKKYNVNFIELSHTVTPSEVMKLMSLGKMHIISNSTFSWWAAYLSKSNQVIAPKQFYRNSFSSLDRFPSDWKLCESIWT